MKRWRFNMNGSAGRAMRAGVAVLGVVGCLAGCAAPGASSGGGGVGAEVLPKGSGEVSGELPGELPGARDVSAIRGLAGVFEVAYSAVSTPLGDGGEGVLGLRQSVQEATAREVVLLVEDKPGRLVLEHLLLIGDPPAVAKHWSQRWTYDPASALRYEPGVGWSPEVVASSLPGTREEGGALPGAGGGWWRVRVSEADERPLFDLVGRWEHPPTPTPGSKTTRAPGSEVTPGSKTTRAPGSEVTSGSKTTRAPGSEVTSGSEATAASGAGGVSEKVSRWRQLRWEARPRDNRGGLIVGGPAGWTATTTLRVGEGGGWVWRSQGQTAGGVAVVRTESYRGVPSLEAQAATATASAWWSARAGFWERVARWWELRAVPGAVPGAIPGAGVGRFAVREEVGGQALWSEVFGLERRVRRGELVGDAAVDAAIEEVVGAYVVEF